MNLTAVNLTIPIAVTEPELQMLLQFSRRRLARQHPAPEDAALWAVRFALANPNAFLNWASSLIHYSELEGVRQDDLAIRQIANLARKLAKQKVR